MLRTPHRQLHEAHAVPWASRPDRQLDHVCQRQVRGARGRHPEAVPGGHAVVCDQPLTASA